ncbi:hypothetical protein H920_10772 [Fukomys damarensis]|uniref:Uncharacterized protein n=1 Tax=Fukomys damarensis TaxID=885580 RepID=A0A091DYI8_FUKDA|nr:hypothetical protein H920_10772 [Fukomys damarensis]
MISCVPPFLEPAVPAAEDDGGVGVQQAQQEQKGTLDAVGSPQPEESGGDQGMSDTGVGVGGGKHGHPQGAQGLSARPKGCEAQARRIALQDSADSDGMAQASGERHDIMLVHQGRDLGKERHIVSPQEIKTSWRLMDSHSFRVLEGHYGRNFVILNCNKKKTWEILLCDPDVKRKAPF